MPQAPNLPSPNSPPPAPGNAGAAEFDEYAHGGYGAGMENPLKRFAGQDAAVFIDLKVAWLLRHLQNNPLKTAAPLRVLDYGCGTALFLRRLRHFQFDAVLNGCDPSSAMLEQARAGWNDAAPAFEHFDGQHLPYADASLDLVIACAVFHHIPPTLRPAVYAEIARVLAPGGRFYIFEHNPWNPATRWVVARTPIDRDAILLSAGEARRGMRNGGLSVQRTDYMMFLPPRMKWAWTMESLVKWLPMGGQYVVVAKR